ncbi:hypothetical protein Tco_1253749 [Tanacetum coccineum]
MFIKSRIYLDDEYVVMTRNYFLQYTQLEIPEFRNTLIHHMESVKKSIDKRAQHTREYDSKVNDRHIQTIAEKVDTSKALDASLVDTESSGTNMEKQDTNSRSGNDADDDYADIIPVYDEEPMAEVPMIVDNNVFATGHEHTEQPKFNNEGEVDHDAEQSHDIRPLQDTLTDNQITELSNQSLEYENTCLKKTVAQFQKDFLRMEAHYANLELKYQNQALKEGQHGQFSNAKSNEAKVKKDINVFETINIKLEHKVAKLLMENETLKKHYKELYNSIKTTRNKTTEQTTSFIAKNNEFKAQLQEKGFAIAALKKSSVTYMEPIVGEVVFEVAVVKVEVSPLECNALSCTFTFICSLSSGPRNEEVELNPKNEGEYPVIEPLPLYGHGRDGPERQSSVLIGRTDLMNVDITEGIEVENIVERFSLNPVGLSPR